MSGYTGDRTGSTPMFAIFLLRCAGGRAGVGGVGGRAGWWSARSRLPGVCVCAGGSAQARPPRGRARHCPPHLALPPSPRSHPAHPPTRPTHSFYSLALIPYTLYRLCGGGGGVEDPTGKTWSGNKGGRGGGGASVGGWVRAHRGLIISWVVYCLLFW